MAGVSVPTTRILGLLTLLLAAVAATLGYAGFVEYLPHRPGYDDAGVADRIYYTAQLFFLDPTPFEDPPYGALLDWARFLAPVSTVLAALQALALLFRDWLRAWTFRLWPGHVIVVGDGPAPAQLARRLVKDGRWVVLVGDGLPVEHARRQGLLVVPGEPRDEVTLQAAGVATAGAVYALAPVGATNASVALAVRAQCRRRVEVFAQVRDDVLVTALRARMRAVGTDPKFELSFFVLEDVAARVLLDEHAPGEEATGTPAPLVVAGSGPFPLAVLRELARRQREHGGRRAVTVVTAQAGAVAAVADPLTAAGLDLTTTTTMPAHAGSATVYVCYADADDVLRAGLGQLRAGVGRVVLCLRRLAELGDALDGQRIFDNAAGRLAVFGVLDAAFDGGRIRNDLVDRLARALHARYVADRLAEGDAPGGTRVPWEQLAQRFRRDNHRQAAHVGTKLAHIGAVLMPAGPGFAPFSYADGEVLVLARMEHERWMEAKLADDFRLGPQRTDTTHPDLVPWETLSAEVQEIDVAFVEALPAVLADAGFQIVRDPRH